MTRRSERTSLPPTWENNEILLSEFVTFTPTYGSRRTKKVEEELAELREKLKQFEEESAKS